MMSWETGGVDTIVDLIVDTLGAVIVGLMAWTYTRTGRYSFIADGVRKFIRKNPRLFGTLEKLAKKTKSFNGPHE